MTSYGLLRLPIPPQTLKDLVGLEPTMSFDGSLKERLLYASQKR